MASQIKCFAEQVLSTVRKFGEEKSFSLSSILVETVSYFYALKS
jgi:hypothetical protein